MYESLDKYRNRWQPVLRVTERTVTPSGLPACPGREGFVGGGWSLSGGEGEQPTSEGAVAGLAGIASILPGAHPISGLFRIYLLKSHSTPSPVLGAGKGAVNRTWPLPSWTPSHVNDYMAGHDLNLRKIQVECCGRSELGRIKTSLMDQGKLPGGGSTHYEL